MMTREPDQAASADLCNRVYLERLRLFYDGLAPSTFALLFASLLLAYAIQTPSNRGQVLVWILLMLLVTLYRFIAIYRYRRQSDEQVQRRSAGWYRAMLVCAATTGAAWGAAGFLFFDASDIWNQSLLAFILAGAGAIAIVSFSSFFEAGATFLVLVLLPPSLRLFQYMSMEVLPIAAMMIIYLYLMLLFARRINRTVIEGLQMSHLRSDAEATIERQALFDALTGLPNRRLLEDRLDQAVARSRRHGSQAALMFLDLDHFKRINDSLGHGVGDSLLVEAARRVTSLLREEDTAARLGGDEFVVLLTDINGSVNEVAALVRRRGEELRAAIEAPMKLEGHEVHMTVSIGVSLLPGDTESIDDLLKQADQAMYRAKDAGRNTLRFFVAEMQEALMRRLDIERKLRSALDHGEGLSLFLQPQYRGDGSVCGAELLLRWRLDGDFVSPATFIPIAEDSGLIYRLGDWVVDESCRIGGEIHGIGERPDFSLAFNVSPRQFRQKDFVRKVRSAIEHHELPEGLLELELTENLLIDDVDAAVMKMRTLRELGVRFSIDDFGTGYSSLRYLKSLPLDSLKIDQSFVRDVLNDPSDASIVRGIVSMARTLNLDVTAEGVETVATHDFLVEAGCHRFQGFLYSPPLPLDEFLAIDRNAASLAVFGRPDAPADLPASRGDGPGQDVRRG